MRKIQLPTSRDAEKTKAKSRSNSIQFELTQRKSRAPSPPHSKIRPQKRNKKSNNDPYYVKVYHSQEVLQLLDVVGAGVGGDGRHSARKWCDAAGGYGVAQELDAGLPELTLLRVGRQAGRPEVECRFR